MKSPTSSILHSIQALKTKMRNDHFELQGIRRDFAMGPFKPILELEQKSESPLGKDLSLDKGIKQKIIEVRKGHQEQLKNIKEEHSNKIKDLTEKYQKSIEKIIVEFESKIKEQQIYIQLLEEQLNSEIKASQFEGENTDKFTRLLKIEQNVISLAISQTKDMKMPFTIFRNNQKSNQQDNKKYNQKYEKVVNQLLKENTLLLQQTEKLKMKNRSLILSLAHINANSPKNQEFSNHHSIIQQQYSMMQEQDQDISMTYRNSQISNRNRLKFSKANKNITDRSYLMINNENIDTTNVLFRHATSIDHSQKQKKQCSSVIENSIVEEDESIFQEQIKLRTIKHFFKVESTDCESQKNHIQNKRGGLRNVLRRMSVI